MRRTEPTVFTQAASGSARRWTRSCRTPPRRPCATASPGSAFKPIVYVTALQNGFTPATIEVDAPFCVWQGAGLGNKCFVNFDKRYAGPKTMRWGVEQSRNLMTVRAASETGMLKVIDTAEKLGVGDFPNYPAIA